MLKHYIKIAFRNFKSNPLIFTGSIASAFLGALCISLLFSYVHNELTMDDFHKREKDIYLMTIQQSLESQPELVDAAKHFDFNYKEFPEIENLVNIKKYNEGELKFSYNNLRFSPEGLITDSTFFEIFDFKLKIGDKNTILYEPDAAIFTEELAQKIFGDENPIGKNITVISRREKEFTIKGIVESPPPNSSINFDFILPSSSRGFNRTGGDFLLVNKSFNVDQFSEKIKDIGFSHIQFKNSITSVVPLEEIYFRGQNIRSKGIFSRYGDARNLKILFAIIVIIFIISVLNFSNLQIININSSLKNFGINKISGAGRIHIFNQKITEILILILISTTLITFACILVLPHFNQFTGVELSPELWKIFLLNISILSILVIVAMIYPSVVFLRIRIINSLKNQVFKDSLIPGRKIIATAQLSLSLMLLIASLVVIKQLDLMLNKDFGFYSENIMRIKFFQRLPLSGTNEERKQAREAANNNFKYIENELNSLSFVKNYAQGTSPIKPFTMPWKVKGGEKDYSTENGLVVTPGYAELLGLTVLDGRFFERERDESRGNKIVINQAAKEFWGIDDISKVKILNKYWSLPQMGAGDGYEIIGVVKDFNSEHLSVTPKPLMMVYMDDMVLDFLIQFESGAKQEGIKSVQALFNKVNPGEPIHYTLLSDEIDALYQKEKRLSEIYIIFTIIAYLISATGLFAIALYDTQKRTKEIGIRKVNGAKVSEILAMLNKNFVKWVVIAFVIATPVAYYAMNKWLENFAYKTELSWWIFALAGLLALGIALLTVSFQSWKAATKNPVESLRYE